MLPEGKWGYVAVGMTLNREGRLVRPGDLIVYVNGRTDHGLYIQRCHDVEGWFEHIVREETPIGGYTRTVHEKADIRIEWMPNRFNSVPIDVFKDIIEQGRAGGLLSHR